MEIEIYDRFGAIGVFIKITFMGFKKFLGLKDKRFAVGWVAPMRSKIKNRTIDIRRGGKMLFEGHCKVNDEIYPLA